MTEKIDSVVSNYNAIQAIVNKAKDLTLLNPKYILEFDLPILGKKSKDSNKDIKMYFDQLNDKIQEYSYLELFACFEATIIEKIKLASGEMKKNIKENYNTTLPFVSYQENFVKNEDDLSSLNKIRELLRNKIPNELFDEFDKMVKYRDRLAHGKRFSETVFLNDLKTTHKTMLNILNEI